MNLILPLISLRLTPPGVPPSAPLYLCHLMVSKPLPNITESLAPNFLSSPLQLLPSSGLCPYPMANPVPQGSEPLDPGDCHPHSFPAPSLPGPQAEPRSCCPERLHLQTPTIHLAGHSLRAIKLSHHLFPGELASSSLTETSDS